MKDEGKRLVVSMLSAALGALSALHEDGEYNQDLGGSYQDWSEAGLEPMERYVLEGEDDAIYINGPNGGTYRVKVRKVRKRK